MTDQSNKARSEGVSNSTLSLPLCLLEDRLFVQTMPEAIEHGLHLRIGSRVVPLQLMDETPATTIPKRFAFLPQDLSEDLVRTANDVTLTRISLDESAAKCLQIEIGRSDHARHVPVGNPIRLPSSSMRYEFRCLLAAEATGAAMELVIDDEHGTRLQSRIVRFDAVHRGGTSRNGYLQIRIPLPASETTRIVTLYALVPGLPNVTPAEPSVD